MHGRVGLQAEHQFIDLTQIRDQALGGAGTTESGSGADDGVLYRLDKEAGAGEPAARKPHQGM